MAAAPMLPGIAPFGIVTGASAITQGLSSWQSLAASVMVFAGAAQLATAQLIGEGALPVVIVLTALTINLRFAMYSASLAPHVQHLGAGWKTLMAYLLVDQNYALSYGRFSAGRADAPAHWFYLGAGVACWLTWQASTAIGVFAAARVPQTRLSLDFAIPLVFLVLLVPPLVSQALQYVPAAVLSALVLPALLRPDGVIDLTLGNPRLTAGLIAGTVAWFSRSVLLTLGAGMGALWLFTYLV
jgi:predicted branched-subunit amino acid permease